MPWPFDDKPMQPYNAMTAFGNGGKMPPRENAMSTVAAALLGKQTTPLPSDFFPQLPPLYQGEIRNAMQRPRDYMSPVAEALSPTLGGYGLGAMGAETAMRASEGDYAGAAEVGVPMALGMFAGPGAKTANMGKLARAQELASRGTHRDTIWNETGWFQGQDGKWRFEIDDSAARFKREPTIPHERNVKGDMRVGDFFEHPELFSAYPEIADAPFSQMPLHPAAGTYDRKTGMISVLRNPPPPLSQKSVALHELQHAVQQREGFAQGSNPEVALKDAYVGFGHKGNVESSFEAVRNALERGDDHAAITDLQGTYTVWGRDELEKLDKQLFGYLMLDDFGAYRKSPGEVEARNVQSRMNLGPGERRTAYPWETE
jgi:hypothetical protein